MFTKTPASISYYRFSSLEPHASVLQHAVFTRGGSNNAGVSPKPFDTLNFRFGIGDPDTNVVKNRHVAQDFFEKTFLHGRKTTLISANQTHSDHIAILRQGENLPEPNYDIHGDGLPENVLKAPLNDAMPHEIDDIDALITDRHDVTLLLQVADCQPIILLDPVGKALGMVHNGWRGCVQSITGKTVRAMAHEFGTKPSDIIVCIGPALGTCCHYFTDPKNELPETFHRYIANDKRVDFAAATKDQLLEAGIRASNIEFSGLCTYDHPEEFFSYRRENRLTGRFGVMAALA